MKLSTVPSSCASWASSGSSPGRSHQRRSKAMPRVRSILSVEGACTSGSRISWAVARPPPVPTRDTDGRWRVETSPIKELNSDVGPMAGQRGSSKSSATSNTSEQRRERTFGTTALVLLALGISWRRSNSSSSLADGWRSPRGEPGLCGESPANGEGEPPVSGGPQGVGGALLTLLTGLIGRLRTDWAGESFAVARPIGEPAAAIPALGIRPIRPCRVPSGKRRR
mmetsp:Transcript_69776/g.204622  ORF Transcript_69776/g.204622 Transcript_69776/m.204622 type:complete len:225 (+) Transcript_69776:414-1088(+)